MAIGWFADLAAAKAWYVTNRLETTFWDDIAVDADKTKAIVNAYNLIYYDPRYSVPTFVAATAAQLVILTFANAEMAYFLAEHQADKDSRLGLQAQNVIEAGIVEEKYKKDAIAVPEDVDNILKKGGFVASKYMYSESIGRDEDEDVDYDPTGF